MKRRRTARIPHSGKAASPKVPTHRRVPVAVTIPLWVQIPESFPTKACPLPQEFS